MFCSSPATTVLDNHFVFRGSSHVHAPRPVGVQRSLSPSQSVGGTCNVLTPSALMSFSQNSSVCTRWMYSVGKIQQVALFRKPPTSGRGRFAGQPLFVLVEITQRAGLILCVNEVLIASRKSNGWIWTIVAHYAKIKESLAERTRKKKEEEKPDWRLPDSN